MESEPAYKINDKITFKGYSGVITKIEKYSDNDLLDSLAYPELDWMYTHQYMYTITYDIPQEYESILMRKKYPTEPNKWMKIRDSSIFEFINFKDVERVY